MLMGLSPGTTYRARWFDPRSGAWLDTAGTITPGAGGTVALPPFPNAADQSTDWALKLVASPAR